MEMMVSLQDGHTLITGALQDGHIAGGSTTPG
jgi:hypothetical protein